MLKLLIDDIIDDKNLLYLSSFEVNINKFLSSFSDIIEVLCSPFLSLRDLSLFCILVDTFCTHLFLVLVCILLTYRVCSTGTSVSTSCVQLSLLLSRRLLLSIFFSMFSNYISVSVSLSISFSVSAYFSGEILECSTILKFSVPRRKLSKSFYVEFMFFQTCLDNFKIEELILESSYFVLALEFE